MADPLEVFSLPLGPLQANCYVVIEGAKGLVIDPGDEADVVIEAFGEFGFAPAAVLVTHGHFDHFGGVAPLAAHFGIPVYIGKADAGGPARDDGLDSLAGVDVSALADPVLLVGEVAIDLPIAVTAVPTPGHSAGAYTFAVGDTHLFVGDLLFNGSIGRTDMAGGSIDALLNSVADLIRRFPPDSLVHPGHGPGTSLGRELALNPFLTPLRHDPEHRW